MATRLVDTKPVEARLEAERLQAGPSGTSSMSDLTESLLFEEEEKKPIPKVAFIVGLSAIAFTGGLTLTLLPSIKRSFNPPRKFSFLNNRHLISPPRLTLRPKSIVAPTQGKAGKGKAKATVEEDEDDFPMPQGEPISPLLALRAFAIATAGVLAVAGATTITVAKLLDVQDMTEFTTKMRSMVSAKMPRLGQEIYRAPPEGSYPTEATTSEENIVEGWLRRVIDEAEEERKVHVNKR